MEQTGELFPGVLLPVQRPERPPRHLGPCTQGEANTLASSQERRGFVQSSCLV